MLLEEREELPLEGGRAGWGLSLIKLPVELSRIVAWQLSEQVKLQMPLRYRFGSDGRRKAPSAKK